MLYVVAYDIANDRRRARVSDVLQAHGPRVQLSMFEVELPTLRDYHDLCAGIARLIDAEEDQVRVYPLTDSSMSRRLILGEHRLEERVEIVLA